MHECKTVTLRTRPLKKNMLSFYLDYYPGYRDKESMKVIGHLHLCQSKEPTGTELQCRHVGEGGSHPMPTF